MSYSTAWFVRCSINFISIMSSICPTLYILITVPIFNTIFLYGIKSYRYPQARKLTAGVRISPHRKNYPRGRPCKKKSFQIIIFSKVSQCRKPTHSTQHYLNTLPKTYPTLLHRGKDPSRLSDAIPYPNTWGSSPLAVFLAYILLRVYMLKKVIARKIFSETVSQCRKLLNSAKNTLLHILIHWNELYPDLKHWTLSYYMARNQNRVLRHPRALGSGGCPFSALGSTRLAIACLNSYGPPHPPSDLLTLLLLTISLSTSWS